MGTGGWEGARPAHSGVGEASLPTETRLAAPKVAEEERAGTRQGRVERDGQDLAQHLIPQSLLLPWFRSALCYSQAQVPEEGLDFQGGIPRGCPLTMPLWLAVPEVPTVEGAVPMVLLLGSLL